MDILDGESFWESFLCSKFLFYLKSQLVEDFLTKSTRPNQGKVRQLSNLSHQSP